MQNKNNFMFYIVIYCPFRSSKEQWGFMGNCNLNCYEPRGKEFESLRAHQTIKKAYSLRCRPFLF
jgi:hypothetical protein